MLEDITGGLNARFEPVEANEELIAAIKRMRELTGMGLKEAKDAVDAYRARRSR